MDKFIVGFFLVVFSFLLTASMFPQETKNLIAGLKMRKEDLEVNWDELERAERELHSNLK